MNPGVTTRLVASISRFAFLAALEPMKTIRSPVMPMSAFLRESLIRRSESLREG
jgi:hypothetical protein